MIAYLAQHRAAFGNACRRLVDSPFGSFLSLAVIGVALALPAAGWLALDNLQKLAGGVTGIQQISVFMDEAAGRQDVAEIEARLKTEAPGKWRFVSREEALKHLQASEGMAEVVASLPRNPLPDAFVIDPDDVSPGALGGLARRLAGWPKVAHVQLDSAWVQRLDALLNIGRLAVLLLAGVFAGALVAVTFNTIRLQILARADEIEVVKLIGATNAYISRPFQYFGALQGALGGLFAVGLVSAGGFVLAPAIEQLLALYGSDFLPHGLTLPAIGTLVGAGAALGWLGARLSVSIHLSRIG